MITRRLQHIGMHKQNMPNRKHKDGNRQGNMNEQPAFHNGLKRVVNVYFIFHFRQGLQFHQISALGLVKIMLHHGELLAQGTPTEVRQNEQVKRVYLGQREH